jgi:hypothetical protein
MFIIEYKINKFKYIEIVMEFGFFLSQKIIIF